MSSLRAVLPIARRLAACMAVAVGLAVASPAFAVDHTQIVPRGHEGDHDRHPGRDFHQRPSVNLFFFGAPAYVAPPPVYYDAPVPLTGVYVSANGYYCRDYQTTVGIETACQQPDGVWRFVN